jgi:hypothetical protein
MYAYVRGEGNPRNAAMDDYMQNVEDFGLTDDMMAGAASSACRTNPDNQYDKVARVREIWMSCMYKSNYYWARCVDVDVGAGGLPRGWTR